MRQVFMFFLLCSLILLNCTTVTAEASDAGTKEGAADVSSDEYLEAILEELDMGEVDDFIAEELPEKTTFTEVIQQLIYDGINSDDMEIMGKWFLDQLFYELSSAKPFFTQILILSILFSLFYQLGSSMGKQVSDMGFLVIYGAMMILLMQSFTLISDVVVEGMEQVFSFLTVLIPVYSTTLFVSGNAASAAFFYEMTFGMIWILEWMMIHILIPAIHIFLLLEFLDHLFEEEKLSKLSELIESGVKTFLKIAMAVIIGFSAVQSLLTPAKDRISASAFIKTISIIPGVGNAFGSAGEILLGCGILIKNCVGIAAVIIILLLCMGPVIKVFCFTFLYRLLSAVMQPVAQRRLVGCVQGVSRSCALYGSVFLHTMLFFLIVIAMVAASTSFVY